MARSDFPFHLGSVQERPRSLSILLIVMIAVYAFLAFGAAIALYAIFTSEFEGTAIEQMPFSETLIKPIAIASLGISLAGAFGGWGMWKWRRWGVYLFAAGALTSLAIELVLRAPVLGSPLHVTILLVLVVMLWGRWRYFD